MATTDKDIINIGLGKIGASKCSSIVPPKSPLERHCADGYPNWRDSELQKRRWVFALDIVTFTQSGPPLENEIQKYRYAIPTDVLRVIRNKRSEWIRRGEFVYSAGTTFTSEVIVRKTAALFDPLFIEVLACRVAQECVEFATQSNAKLQTANALYKEAINQAGRANAFVIGTEDTETDDDHSSWVFERWG